MPYTDPNSVQNPVAGAAIQAAWGDQVRDDLQACIAPPAVRVYKSGTQSIPHDTLTVVSFDSEAIDSHDMHDTVTNNERLTIPTNWDMRMLIGAEVRWANSTAGSRRYAEVQVNNAGLKIDDDEAGSTSSGWATNRLCTLWSAAATDYFTLHVYQDSGSNLDILVDGYAGTSFWAVYQSLRNVTG